MTHTMSSVTRSVPSGLFSDVGTAPVDASLDGAAPSSSITALAPSVVVEVTPPDVRFTAERRAAARDSGRELSSQRVRSIQRAWGRMRVALWLCADLVAATTAVSTAQTARLGSEPLATNVARATAQSTLTYAQVSFAVVVAWLMVVGLVGGYHQRRNVSVWDQSINVFRAAVALLAVIGVAGLFLRVQLSRSFVLVALVSAVTFTVVGRLAIASLFAMLQRLGIGVDRLLLVGPRDEVEARIREREGRAQSSHGRRLRRCWLAIGPIRDGDLIYDLSRVVGPATRVSRH